MDDQIAAAAARLAQSARISEPVATQLIDNIAEATHGGRVRAGTLFKTEDSIREKLRRFSYGKPARVAKVEARLNDALRYTLVYDEDRYWNAVTNGVADGLSSLGHELVIWPRGWRRNGYKGINLTVRSPSGALFEVQVHTPASIDMAERTHAIYERQRGLDYGNPEWLALEKDQNDLWALVSRPADVPEID